MDFEIEVPGCGVVACVEYGDPAGRPVLFFHGWPSSRLQGKLCHADAARLGLRVVAFDRPGVGGSERGGVGGLQDWPWFVTSMADVLGLGENFSVLGVSGGAPYVYACAWGLPERLERAAVLCGAVPLAEVSDAGSLMLPYRVMIQARERAPWMLGGMMHAGGLMTGLPVSHPAVWAMLRFVPPADRRVMEQRLVHDCVAGSFREALRGGVDGMLDEASVYVERWPFALEEVHFPIRFWHGELDRHIPADLVREVVGRLPAAEVEWFEDEGHYSIAAGRTGEVLAWLSGAEGEAGYQESAAASASSSS